MGESINHSKYNIPEVEPTEEELDAIRRGKEQIARGEYISFKTIEEMESYFLNDENDTEA